jgi:hypothetical protein
MDGHGAGGGKINVGVDVVSVSRVLNRKGICGWKGGFGGGRAPLGPDPSCQSDAFAARHLSMNSRKMAFFSAGT